MRVNKLITLALVGALASVVLAKPRQSVTLTFVRPYQPPKESTILGKRVKILEEELGQERFDFEYSLPANTKLMVKIIFRKNGIVDNKASAMFYITRRPTDRLNAGSFTISRCSPQPKNPNDYNRWYVMLDDRYGYGFSEGTPKDYLFSASQQQNIIVGDAVKQEKIAFAQEEVNRKFSVVVKVKAIPMGAKDKINDVTRHALSRF